jgi:hypothetical protein
MIIPFIILVSATLFRGVSAAEAPRQKPIQAPSIRPIQPSQKLAQKPIRPRLKKGQYIEIKSRMPASISIQPKPVPAFTASKGLTYFEIIDQDKTQLILRFRTRDPKLHLSHNHSIAIQLITDDPFRVEPSIILTSEWPKNSEQISIKMSNPKPHAQNRIIGEAAYTYCSQQTKQCTKAKSSLVFYYSP